MTKELLFSVTKDDCKWSYTRGTGAGGQKKNKTSSAVHCMHEPSGAHGYSEESRSQLDNRSTAFKKMVETKEFQIWHKLEIAKRMRNYVDIDEIVDEQMKHVKLEIKVDGKWLEVDDLECEPESLQDI